MPNAGSRGSRTSTTATSIGVAIEAIYGVKKMQFGSNASTDTGDLKDHGVITGYFATTN